MEPWHLHNQCRSMFLPTHLLLLPHSWPCQWQLSQQTQNGYRSWTASSKHLNTYGPSTGKITLKVLCKEYSLTATCIAIFSHSVCSCLHSLFLLCTTIHMNVPYHLTIERGLVHFGSEVRYLTLLNLVPFWMPPGSILLPFAQGRICKRLVRCDYLIN
jgi:hypothetical protein